MTNFISAKLLLTIYKKLPTAVLHIDNAVDKAVKQSFYYQAGQSTLVTCNNIIKLNSEKADYINIKVLVDKATALMLYEDKELLFLRFVKGQTFRAISDKLNRSLRQTFRAFDSAVESFAAQLVSLGLDNEKILEKFGYLPLIANEIQRFRDEGFFVNDKKD